MPLIKKAAVTNMDEKKISKRNKKSVGIFEYAFTSYGRLTEKWKKSAVCSLLYRASASKAASRVRKLASRSSEKSVLLGAVRRFAAKLPSVTLRAYGTFIFSLGFYSALVYVIKAIASTLEADMDALIFSGMLIIASIPLLLSGRTLAEAVLESRVGSFVAFDLLGYRPEAAQVRKSVIKRCDIAMIAGMVLGLCSFYLNIEYIAATVAAVVLVYLALTVPEGATVVFIALAPIMRMTAARVFVTVLLVGYLYKLLTGRRTFKLDLCDSVMLIFDVLVVLGDTIHYGNGTEIGDASHLSAVVVYFLIVNLMRNDKWRRASRAAVAFGGVVTAALFVASCYLPERMAGVTFVSDALERSRELMLGLMQSSGSAFLYVAAVLPMLMADISDGESKKRSGGAAIFTVLMLAAVVMSRSRSVWLSAAVGVIVLLLFLNSRLVAVPVAAAVLVPIATFVLPDEISVHIKRLLDFSGEGTVANINVRENSVRMLLDNVFGGIGSADGVFSSYYSVYTGTGAAPDSAKNLLLGVGVGLGITGLLVFALALVFLFAKMYTHAKSSGERNSESALAGFFAMIFGGLAVDIFADPKMFLLFFVYAAFASSYTAVSPMQDDMLKTREQNECFASKDIEFE